MDDKAKWMVVGVATLLAFKYVIFGLDTWNGFLHPDRHDPPGAFSRPLLGLL